MIHAMDQGTNVGWYKRWIREQWENDHQGCGREGQPALIHWAELGESKIREQAMGQGAMVQGVMEGSMVGASNGCGSNRRSMNGTSDGSRNTIKGTMHGCKRWVREQSKEQWMVQIAIEGAMDRWAMEGAMDQREIKGAMDQGPIERATDQEAIEGMLWCGTNKYLNQFNTECYKQSIGEQAMDQGAIEWAMDVTSGEIEGAMDQGASFE